MTKQPPYVSKLRLSRICRWLMALGVVKLCIFGALVAGYPLPELSWDLLRGNATTESADAGDKQAQTKPTSTLAAMDELLLPASPSAQSAPSGPAAPTTPTSSETQPAPPTQQLALRNDPQGAAAARAAAALGNTSVRDAVAVLTPEVTAALIVAPSISTPTQESFALPFAQATGTTNTLAPTPATTQANAPVLPGQPLTTASAVADTSTTQVAHKEDKSWWSHVLQLKALPFPRMGLDQVAHAATLDSPPPPAMSAPANAGGRTSAFTPPAQIPSGLNADGSPIAPRSTTAQPRPAGTSGPQFDDARDGQNSAGGGSIPSMLTPTSNVPAPRTDVYVAPEDPNRKQQELARREQEVLVLKQQMEQRLEELQAAERKVQGLLDEAKEVEAKKVSRLAAIYVNMKPKQAAKALESMEERTAVKILAGMSPKQSGEILTYADPKKTAKFTELISRMRTGQ